MESLGVVSFGGVSYGTTRNDDPVSGGQIEHKDSKCLGWEDSVLM